MVTANEMVLCLFLMKYREIPVFCHGKPNNMSKKQRKIFNNQSHEKNKHKAC